jgi:hypothetical protein
MKDINKILEYYPKLKSLINKDKPKIYDTITNSNYIKDGKLNPNVGLIYDFGGTENPVKGKNVVIVDYDPDKDVSYAKDETYYDKDTTIYKNNAEDPNVTLPESLEVNGKLYIAYADILNFPKYLKAKELSMAFCNLDDDIFDSKLVIEKNLILTDIQYNGENIINKFSTPQEQRNLGYIQYPTGNYGYPEAITKKIRDKIIQNGGKVGGDIIIQ